MKTFIQGGLLVGFLAIVAGLCLILDKIDLFQNGVATTATIIGFDSVKERARYGYRTVYYPLVEYYFQNKRYQQKYHYRQISNTSPLAKGDTIAILCSSSRIGKPYFGAMTQLVMISLFLPITGLTIMAFFFIMGCSVRRENEFDSNHHDQNMNFAPGNEPFDSEGQNGNRW